MNGEIYPSGVDGQDGPEGHPEIAFCECGEAWFAVEHTDGMAAVALERGTGHVVATHGLYRCIGCGDLKATSWTGA